MKKDAVISDCQDYRYALWRVWAENKPVVMFVGLNPSVADAQVDDPTLRRCINYAKSWGYGGLIMANLFAYRETHPNEMKKAKDPIGPENDYWLKTLADEADIVVACWGNDGMHLNRSKQVNNLLVDPFCLKINKSGEPAHPARQEKTLQPIPYSGSSHR